MDYSSNHRDSLIVSLVSIKMKTLIKDAPINGKKNF